MNSPLPKILGIFLISATAPLGSPAPAQIAGTPAGTTTPHETNAAALSDVDLLEVPTPQALRLIAELYDLSIISGSLPGTPVSLRLRGATASDVLAALELAAGLEIEPRGAVYYARPLGEGGRARRVVRHPLAADPSALDWLRASGLEARSVDADTLVLEGPPEVLDGASSALLIAREASLTQRVFPLGAAPGDETLMAVQSLLDETFESATYSATSHQLAVSALPSTLENVDGLLEELTRPPTQFEIEVQLVEVSTNALERMGAQGFVRLEVSGGLLPTTFPLKGLDDGHRYLPSPRDLASLGDLGTAGGGVPGSLTDSGFRFGQIDARGVGFLLELLEQSGDAKVVATPKVTALDNREARISMVTTLRIPTFTQNQAFATTTVSGIETVDVGTVLEVRPRRLKDRQVALTVTPEVSELEPTQQTFSQAGLTQGLPVITRRRTETEVILEGGETLVIGGLVRERLVNTLGKTPGLGDLPWIGRAFQHRGQDSLSTELLVFVTPRELPSAEERRGKTRIGDRWIASSLAQRLEQAKTALGDTHGPRRLAGLEALTRLDAELRPAGVDVGPDIGQLRHDESLDVRVAAARFFLRRRPEAALFELTLFRDNRQVALGALGAPLAPHVRVAVGELILRSQGGEEALAERCRRLAVAGRTQEAGRLLDTLAAVAPIAAASVAAELDGVPTRLRLEALGGHAASAATLVERVDGALSMEHRAVALAALARARSSGLGGLPHRTTEPTGLSEAEILTVRHGADLQPVFEAAAEPALGWSGEPEQVRITGRREEEKAVIEDALDLLARRTPDLRHLVGFAFASLEAGTRGPLVDPRLRHAVVRTDLPVTSVAAALVRLAGLVFEERVRGFKATGGRSLARAVRLEIEALERLLGAPCPPEHADATVARALLASALEGEDYAG